MSLVCPACGREHAEDERFCRACGVPLVTGEGPREALVSERSERARRIKPQLAEGELVRVAIGRQLPEAELIQNLLLDEGVPSTLRRTRGFDVPEMLAAGPRDVLVPQSGVEVARQVLLEAEMLPASSRTAAIAPGRVFAWLLVALAAVAVFAIIIDLTTR